ncbi:hypothetical protein DFH09DRAFT_1246876 [Mycena vulgaris]|nr:hypothetical protein DFH09DRAFT_1246876 [Mycena vulgaris]
MRHGCPFCTKKFPNQSILLNHLNQPSGRCHHAFHIRNFAKRLRRNRPRGSSPPEDENWTTDDEIAMNVDVDLNPTAMDVDESFPPGSETDSVEADFVGHTNRTCREDFRGAARTVGGGKTFIDHFHNDQHADKRAQNLYYPFATEEEWELVSWLTRANLSMAATNEFLKLRLVKKLSLSFSTSKDLRSRVEILPQGPQWQSKRWETVFPVKRPLTLFYRDPVQLLQSLLQNPLVQDYIHYTPFRLYTTAARTMRVYTEWLSGNVAWEMQEQLPKGATVLGTIASTDKTQITTMTGNRVAHPLLISTSNIDMDFRMKASHHAFLLGAMIPIAKFKEKNKDVRGVLQRRLYHACLDFFFAPLKNAARVGVMLSDAFGKQRFCFTPLASHIVDTPESLLVAGVAANASSLTTASYKQFGDSFQHPPRTADYTLSLIEEIEGAAHPWDFPRYLKIAKKRGLNGVHRPYWSNWPLSDPSRFLTPEILHHWLKFAWDYDLQWCILAMSEDEIDFRFSVLRPHTGMRHFKEGVSRAKQVTGREHRDMQRYLVALIAGSENIPRELLVAVRALQDFRYHGQAPKIDESVLNKMDAALKTFHENKHAILEAGVRRGKNGPIDNWWIPKLEFMQSVVASIRANGVPLQWSADITEHAHITLIKDPASHSNNQNHEQQICRYLDRRDKVAQFDLATAIECAGVELDVDPDEEEDDDDGPILVDTTADLLQRIEPMARLGGSRRLVNYFTLGEQMLRGEFPNALKPFRTFASSQGNTAFHLGRDPSQRLAIDAASEIFKLPDLEPALLTYLHRLSSGGDFKLGGRRPALRNAKLPFRMLQVWHRIRLQSRAFHNPTQLLVPETVNASPPSPAWEFGRGDGVIVNTDTQHTWPHSGLQGHQQQPLSFSLFDLFLGHTVGYLRMVMRVVPNGGFVHPPGTDGFLAYIQRFDVVNPAGSGGGPHPDPDTGMYHVRRAWRTNGAVVGDIIPLDRLRALVELTPRFGSEADRRLTKENSLDYSEDFWLTPYFTKELFFALSQ